MLQSLKNYDAEFKKRKRNKTMKARKWREWERIETYNSNLLMFLQNSTQFKVKCFYDKMKCDDKDKGNVTLPSRRAGRSWLLMRQGPGMSLVASPGPCCASSLGSLIFFALPLTKDLNKREEGMLLDNCCVESTCNCSVNPGPTTHLPVVSGRREVGGRLKSVRFIHSDLQN